MSDQEKARELLAGIHALYGGAGTFTIEQLDEYATGVIATALAAARVEGRQQEWAALVAFMHRRSGA